MGKKKMENGEYWFAARRNHTEYKSPKRLLDSASPLFYVVVQTESIIPGLNTS